MRYVVILFLPLFIACMHPQIVPVDSGDHNGTVVEKTLGCAAGGMGVHTAADLRCYLKQFDPRLVRMINEEIAVLIFPADSIADWIGGANIYHIPTVSSVTLDRNGYVEPPWSGIQSRAAWEALRAVLFDAVLMEELRQAVADEWQTADPKAVTLKLGIAYQEGRDVVFLWSLVGLDADDPSFYCVGQGWRIGNTHMESIPACAEFQPPATRLGQMEYQLEQPEQVVQLSIGGLQSNKLTVTVKP